MVAESYAIMARSYFFCSPLAVRPKLLHYNQIYEHYVAPRSIYLIFIDFDD
jgi:hypothetical protein